MQFLNNIINYLAQNTARWIYPLVSFALSAGLIPIIILSCRKHGWYDKVDERKIHKGNIPRLGGVGFVTAFSAVTLVYVLVTKDYSNTRLAFVISGLIIFIFGVMDDFLTLKAYLKLIVQIAASLIAIAAGFRFRTILSWELPMWLSFALTFFWMIGIINAYNLIDGVDALCGSLSAMVILTLGLIYTKDGSTHQATVCMILVAAIMGFLLYNKPKAKIFMGDGGSQFLGFMIAVLPLEKTTAHFESTKFFLMAVLVSLPAIDCIAAIWRRLREHRGIMTPDKRHLHHKLMGMGLSPVHVLLFLAALQLLLCAGGYISMRMRTRPGLTLLLTLMIAVIIFFIIIHFCSRALKKPDPCVKVEGTEQ